jgi:BirA family biotin operon repressor/biotin-[acetyl-CoA-carboxylase] ligase
VVTRKNIFKPEMQHLEDNHIESGDLSSEAIIAELRSDFWKKIICYGSVDSTNDLALALSLKSSESRTVIISDSQAKGRGRLGRVWASPPGRNIYMSAVLVPEIEPREVTFLTVAAALACASALRSKTGIITTIKWPNDLMARGNKIGGILTELRSVGDKIKFAVIGMGINLNSGSEDFPEELRHIATSVKEETGRDHPRNEIIAEILNELERWYKRLINESRFPLLEEWRKQSSTIAKRVRITLCKEELSGLAEDIDDEGMLVLKLASGEKRRISAGDLTELR